MVAIKANAASLLLVITIDLVAVVASLRELIGAVAHGVLVLRLRRFVARLSLNGDFMP